jgi:hypothetical protein
MDQSNQVMQRLALDLSQLSKHIAIRVGSVWAPPAQAEKMIGQFCKQIFCVNDSDTYPYTFRGSGVAVKIMNEHLVFCCDHQLANYTPEQVAVHARIDDRLIHASVIIRPNVTSSNFDGDVIDLRALKYEMIDYPLANLSTTFFAMNPDRHWPADSTPNLIVFGFPFERQEVDYEAPRVRARLVRIHGEYVGPTSSPWVHQLRMSRRVRFDPDGMSGGPVFYLGRSGSEYFLDLAGVVIRGSEQSENLYFIEAQALLEGLSRCPRDHKI